MPYRPELEQCEVNDHTLWKGVCYGYKGVLLLAGILLAYDTRNVKLKTVSDSKFVALCIYNIVVCYIFTIVIVDI